MRIDYAKFSYLKCAWAHAGAVRGGPSSDPSDLLEFLEEEALPLQRDHEPLADHATSVPGVLRVRQGAHEAIGREDVQSGGDLLDARAGEFDLRQQVADLFRFEPLDRLVFLVDAVEQFQDLEHFAV